ncbi:globin domain-containing protein [Streptomyces sp. RB6PN23]|uniref:nitric oxide dioxygenase n=1 Tax=Streptomyces silvisoli TaxID=3034235 RepID=A0ABT5ZNQ2_9ACTN|nr:globin domain-containing protein [Streptomyces silvisoli]MDF3291341.1 globin domain-containing protein [Streptomyces silvisoli]
MPQQRGAQSGAVATHAGHRETPPQSEGSWFDPSPANPTEHQRPAPPNPSTEAPQAAAEARTPEPSATWGSTPPVPGVHTPRSSGAATAEPSTAARRFTAPQQPTAPQEGAQWEHGGPAARQPATEARPSVAPEPQPAVSAQPSAAPRPTAPEPAASRGEPTRTTVPAPRATAKGAAPSADAVLIRRTMDAIEPVADKTTSYFYALLFLGHPELRDLFPAAMDAQRDRLFKALLTAAKHVDDADTLTEYLSNLGRGHRKYGTRPEHYPAVGECLLGALARYASDVWNEEVEAAWVRAYTAISQIMIDAAAAAELTSPPWWQAEVVNHERRTKDIAVVTVRPDQPYPFLAGQYTSVETPWWPRVWRHYSFASAPRPDGLLSFHIKAVPAGWVSSALVNRARPGDVIRLGPPAGSMIVDHGTDNGLLCLGGGTGIAPIKALVEDVAEHGRRRAVEVFYGARSGHDLYDLDTMLRLEQEHSWLSVRPVVSEGPSGGLTGPLSEVVSRCGPWHSFDAYLSGPAGMIRSSVDALVGIGMPAHRIRHDSVAELVGAAGH